MAEISEYVRLYVDQEALPEVAKDIKTQIVPNTQKIIGPGNVGYDTGHLHDNIQSTYAVNGRYAVVMSWYTPDYGKYINEDGGSNHWKGIHFMERGADKTIALYKG